MRNCPSPPSRETNSSRLTCGRAYRSFPHSIATVGMMAKVSGILILKVVPRPRVLRMSTVPPMFSILVFTTSMPTPRPDTLETCSRVENPGTKIRSSISRGLIRARSAFVMSPRSSALAEIRSGSIPAPSSATSMVTCPPSWKALSVRIPSAGFPFEIRTSGVSMPWSMELRTKWVSGSLIASRMVLSSSVSRPSMTNLACRPQASPRSRTTRGNLLHTLSMGCIRVFMTPSCSSLAIRFNRCEVRSRLTSPVVPAYETTWLRVSTSSPTKRMSESRRSTSTRRVESAIERRCSVGTSSASSRVAGAEASSKISPKAGATSSSCR
ncbi:hypothetical protein GALL_369110 [mine drainage metagenome]|uniref:Uncharacterized protein n=1 Tax=mine drainage metagenome TaxID=410659 RepID=A0A1J5QD34_9ZZZZ